VPSSTSSSNTRIPNLSYRKEWLYTLLLFLSLVALSEWLYRHYGYFTSVRDNNRFWALHRSDVYASGGQSRIVIAGASRAQLGLIPSVVESTIPQYRAKQLTLEGTPAFGVVEDLCNDPGFNGIILWSATASMLFPAEKKEERRDDVCTAFYRKDFRQGGSLEKNVNCYISALIQEALVTASSNLTLRSLLDRRFQIRPNYLTMTFERYRPARYFASMSGSERAEHKRKRLARHRSRLTAVSMTKFREHTQTALAELYQRLRSRGGELILLRMPTTEEHWIIDEACAPKKLFWDQVSDLSGIPTIHFRDYPELMEFDCPDTSHLDATDAPEFTRRLSKIVKAIIESRSGKNVVAVPSQKTSSKDRIPELSRSERSEARRLTTKPHPL
jgi:hypothetical protein